MTPLQAIEAALGPRGFIDYLRGKAIEYYWRPLQIDNPLKAAADAEDLNHLLSQKIEEYLYSNKVQSTEPPLKADDDKRDPGASTPINRASTAYEHTREFYNSVRNRPLECARPDFYEGCECAICNSNRPK